MCPGIGNVPGDANPAGLACIPGEGHETGDALSPGDPTPGVPTPALAGNDGAPGNWLNSCVAMRVICSGESSDMK